LKKANFHVRQVAGYGLGNFIMTTPAIQMMADHFDVKVPVIFHDGYITEFYEQCPFLYQIPRSQMKETRCVFTTAQVNYRISDIIHFVSRAKKRLGISKKYPIKHPYVDALPSPRNDEYTVIIWGNASKGSVAVKKDVGSDIYKYILDRIDGPVVLVGNTRDYKERLKGLLKHKNCDLVLDKTKEILGLINGAKRVIANDSGLYHVSAALKKPTFVIWKDTWFEKNREPGKNMFYSQKGNWQKDFVSWRNSEA